MKFTVVLSWSGVSNTTGDFWTAPRAPSVSDTSPVGVTGVTVGVYVAVAGVPFLSTRFTVTDGAVPVNDFSGVNVTVPSLATVYVPTFSTVFVVLPSSNVAGVSLSIGTSGFPGVNSGVPFCSFPWISVDSAGFDVGITGVTVGVYLAETGVPFASFACTVTGSGVPVKSLFGVNVTFPDFGLIVYLPTSFPSLVAGTSVSVIGSFVTGL